MRDIPADMRIAVTQIEQSAMLDLYEVDLSRFGGNVYRFHDGMNGLLKPVIWQGNRYDPYPVQVTGLSMTAQGASARPKMTFANIDGLLTAINNDYDDALGAIVTRRQVMEQYLDAVNFPDGNNQADPSREAVQKFVIEQRENSDSDFVTYVLALPTETDNAQIPAWLFRLIYARGDIVDRIAGMTGLLSQTKRISRPMNRQKISALISTVAANFATPQYCRSVGFSAPIN